MEDYKNMPLLKDRLKWARARKGDLEGKKISQDELAKRVAARIKRPFPQSTIGAYESGTRGTKGTPKEIFAIAEELGVSAEWLSKNKGSPFDADHSQSEGFDSNVKAADVGARMIPLIDYVHAGTLSDVADPFPAGGAYEYIPTDDFELSGSAFALEIEGDSMEPEFKEGDRVIIDPDVMPKPGDYVVAKNHEEKATFKRYKLRKIDANGNEVFELEPLNPVHATLRSDEMPLRIIGTMMEHRKRRRR